MVFSEEFENFFFQRLLQLRLNKGVSARDMSLSIGQNVSYINSIENKRSYPSFPMFFFICEYFGITPMEFFNINNYNPVEIAQLIPQIYSLEKDEIEHITSIVNDITKYKLKNNLNKYNQ